MTTTAFEMPEELRGQFNDAIKSYWDRPVRALFLIRGEEKRTQIIQTLRWFHITESKFVEDYDMLNILDGGGTLVLATYTTIEEACEHMETHMKTRSRFPFFSLRDIDVNDVMPMVKFLEENHSDFHLMLDKPECYAEQYRHLLPEL